MDKQFNFDLFAPDYKDFAYSLYEELRENAPVYRIRMPNGLDGWIITRYEDAVNVLKDPRFLNRGRTVLGEERFSQLIAAPEIELLLHHMLAMDPPDHTRLRG